jgi:FMN phosphatase YigB (HAD superfamily)
MPSSTLPVAVHTVTFDCWSTLIYESSGRLGAIARTRRLASLIGMDEARTAEAFAAAWRLHQEAWHRRVVFAAPDMLRYVLSALGVELAAEPLARLRAQMEEEILERDVLAIAGTRELLQTLRAAGVRTALICDTGFTPGRVVRALLDRLGLGQFLEVTIFSDEIGVPKPHPRAFTSALIALGREAHGAIHVGDLRRSDVAGAQATGMTAVRFRGHHDDSIEGPGNNAGVIDCAAAGCSPPCPRPEADAVVDSYAELADLLGPRLSLA